MIARYRSRAIQDIDEICKWRTFSDFPVRRFETAIFTAIELLGEHPYLAAPTDEPHVRRWPIPKIPYTIFYRIRHEEDAIEILRVLDARRVRELGKLPN